MLFRSFKVAAEDLDAGGGIEDGRVGTVELGEGCFVEELGFPFCIGCVSPVAEAGGGMEGAGVGPQKRKIQTNSNKDNGEHRSECSLDHDRAKITPSGRRRT